jgi:hypothetical protein
MSASPRQVLGVLEAFSQAKAETHGSQISAQPADAYLPRIAAAALFRLPRCLRALSLLADAGLSLEANTIARTIIELAITACWIGTDDRRAALVWNRFVVKQQRAFIRLGEFLKMMGPVPKAHFAVLKQIEEPPDLFSCAQAAIDTPEFPARRIAIAIYRMLYDTYSADTHGDIRHVLNVVWFGEADLLEHVVDDAIDVSVVLLAAVSLQLGFRADVENLLNENEFPSPFRSSAAESQ